MDEHQDQHDTPTFDPLQGDPLLSALIRATESSGNRMFGVTVTVEGLVISGIITPISEYFDEIASWFERAGSHGLADAYRPQGEQEQQPEDWEPRYLHLTGIRAFLGSMPVPSDPSTATPWRIRLSSISGWCMGNLAEGPPQHPTP